MDHLTNEQHGRDTMSDATTDHSGRSIAGAPALSIGLAVYNGERYLAEALDSILRQTFRDFELIISDNGSTDRTEEICRSYAARDPRVRYHRNPTNLGVAANYNGTVHMARAALFRWATYDDLLEPRNLELCVRALAEHPEAVLAYPRTVNIDDDGAVIGKYDDEFEFTDPRPHRRFRDLLRRVHDYDCNAEYGVLRRSTLLATGMEADYHAADKVLLAELVLHGTFVEVPERLYCHRFHQDISTHVEKSAREWNEWFNPALVGKRSYPRLRRFVEHVRAIRRAPLSAYQRSWCYAHLALSYLNRDKWRRLSARVAGAVLPARDLRGSDRGSTAVTDPAGTTGRTGASGRVRLALIGPFGYGNLGDAATQDGMISNLRRRLPEAEIIGVSLNPDDTTRRHEISSIPLGRHPGEGWSQAQDEVRFERGIKRIAWIARHLLIRILLEFRIVRRNWRNLRDVDALIVSGGGQLDDYWGGPFSHPLTLLKWALTARLRGARVLFVSVGAGPIDSRLSALFIKSALRLGHYRSFRDEGSKELLERLGFCRDDPVFADLAHSLDVAPTTSGPAGPLRIGVGPMSYFKQYFWPEYDDDVYARYLDALGAFIDRLVADGHSIVLFPGEAGADARAIDDLRAVLQDRHGLRPDRVAQPEVDTVEHLMATLTSVDVVVASRFHGVLLGHVAGKPVLALSYHPKIDHVMRDMGHDRFCFDISSFNVESLTAAFHELVRCRADLERQVGEREDAAREDLDVQYDRIVAIVTRRAVTARTSSGTRGPTPPTATPGA